MRNLLGSLIRMVNCRSEVLGKLLDAFAVFMCVLKRFPAYTRAIFRTENLASVLRFCTVFENISERNASPRHSEANGSSLLCHRKYTYCGILCCDDV
jgi:hypothetical protein